MKALDIGCGFVKLAVATSELVGKNPLEIPGSCCIDHQSFQRIISHLSSTKSRELDEDEMAS